VKRPGGDARPFLFPTDKGRPICSASSAPSAVPPCFLARGCLTRRARPGSSLVPRAWLTRSTGSGPRSRGSKGTAGRVFDLLKHAVGEADIYLPLASHGTSDALTQSHHHRTRSRRHAPARVSVSAGCPTRLARSRRPFDERCRASTGEPRACRPISRRRSHVARPASGSGRRSSESVRTLPPNWPVSSHNHGFCAPQQNVMFWRRTGNAADLY